MPTGISTASLPTTSKGSLRGCGTRPAPQTSRTVSAYCVYTVAHIKALFDTLDHDLVVRAVRHHTDRSWVLLYVERWLMAPLQREDGTLVARDQGSPQGSASTPPTQWITWGLVALRVGIGAAPHLVRRAPLPDWDTGGS